MKSEMDKTVNADTVKEWILARGTSKCCAGTCSSAIFWWRAARPILRTWTTASSACVPAQSEKTGKNPAQSNAAATIECPGVSNKGWHAELNMQSGIRPGRVETLHYKRKLPAE
ncbi:MAG TPA: hypothetical protein ENL37_06625 [Desulfobacteraceae bacterium]|nr:hypothetical protein [Desulfobacteraceae bacterium]